MARPVCPLCGRRRARRSCPALGEPICSACCGTKRRTEIACPTDCVYLESASAHPPAVVQRQRERDGSFLLALFAGMTAPQQRLTAMLLEHLAAERPESVGLTDVHVEQAAGALARTYETASRGIVYEHAADTAAAERLAAGMKRLFDTDRANGGRIPDHDTAGILRRVEAGAREARRALGDGDERAWLSLLRRFWTPAGGGPERAPEADEAGRTTPGGLILPP